MLAEQSEIWGLEMGPSLKAALLEGFSQHHSTTPPVTQEEETRKKDDSVHLLLPSRLLPGSPVAPAQLESWWSGSQDYAVQQSQSTTLGQGRK